MLIDINHALKIAGLDLKEEGDASPEHEQKEHELFKKAHTDLVSVEKMAGDRLKNPDLSPEHKKQYEALQSCAKHCCDEMKKHLESYNKLDEGVGAYTVHHQYTDKEPGEFDEGAKRAHYEIRRAGEPVGELSHGSYFGDVTGKLHGKDLPPLDNYKGSDPQSKLHSFLKSNTGVKWAANLHKYQK